MHNPAVVARSTKLLWDLAKVNAHDAGLLRCHYLLPGSNQNSEFKAR